MLTSLTLITFYTSLGGREEEVLFVKLFSFLA